MTYLGSWSLALLLAGTLAGEPEPIISTKVVTSNLPGEPCTESVETCVPYWREILDKRGTGFISVHISRSEGNPEERFVEVTGVAPGGPGERAGVRAGDRVLSINGLAMGPDPGRHLPPALLSIGIGEEVTYVLRRGGEEFSAVFVSEKALPKSTNTWIYMCVVETFGYAAGEEFRSENDTLGGPRLGGRRSRRSPPPTKPMEAY